MATSATIREPAGHIRQNGQFPQGDAERHIGTTIRPLERADLRSVAALFRETFQVGPRHTEPALAAFFERTLLDHPWADPEIRPLVAVDANGIPVGLIAAEVRRMTLAGRTLRFAWAGHTAVTPEARRRAVGVLLMRKLLEGPQDATFGDSASPLVEHMWVRLGGQRVDLKAIHWVRVFRPVSVVARLIAPRRPRLRAGMCWAADRFDGLTSSVARRIVAPAPGQGADEPLTPAAMVANMRRVARRAVLRPAYDHEFLEWLFAELRRVKGRGELVARLVRNGRSRPIGWYIYYLRPGGRSEVLQVAAAGERDLGTVLDHLLAHAYAHGSAALRGRLEPGMVQEVVRRRCVLWHRGGTLVHTRHPDVMAAVESNNALITRLEGDAWLDRLVDVTR